MLLVIYSFYNKVIHISSFLFKKKHRLLQIVYQNKPGHMVNAVQMFLFQHKLTRIQHLLLGVFSRCITLDDSTKDNVIPVQTALSVLAM